MVKRIVAIGSESTGKTTLVRQLADAYGEPFVEEYGREYTEVKYARGETEWTSREFAVIAAEQQRRENLAAAQAHRFVFCDTNAFATAIWHERYMGFRDPETDDIGARDQVDLYLLTSLDVPFESDDIRDGESFREWMDQVFEREITAEGIPWIRLWGNPRERLEAAQEEIERLFSDED